MPEELKEALLSNGVSEDEFIQAANDFLLNSKENIMYCVGLRLKYQEVQRIIEGGIDTEI